MNHNSVVRRYTLQSSARVNVDEAGITGMVIILREPIGSKHFRIVRNCARFWKCCLELFYGFAEVFCSAVLPTRPPGFVGCEEISRSRAQKCRTSQNQRRVLSPGNLLRSPTPNSVCPLQRESPFRTARWKRLGKEPGASYNALHCGGLRREQYTWFAVGDGVHSRWNLMAGKGSSLYRAGGAMDSQPRADIPATLRGNVYTVGFTHSAPARTFGTRVGRIYTT